MSSFVKSAVLVLIFALFAARCLVAQPECVANDGVCNALLAELVRLETSTAQELKKIYWAELGTMKVRRADPDGSNVEDFYQLAAAPNLMDVSDKYVYVAVTLGNGYIRRIGFDGTTTSIIVNGTGATGPLGIAVSEDDETIFWVDDNTKTLKRTEIASGATTEIVSTGTSSPSGMDYVAGHVYWADQNNDTVERVTADGGNRETMLTMASGISNPFTVKADPFSDKIYTDDFGANAVFRANNDGGAFETLFTVGQPTEIALDPYAGHVYVGDLTGQFLYRADLDGSDLTNLNIGSVNQPVALGLYFDDPD